MQVLCHGASSTPVALRTQHTTLRDRGGCWRGTGRSPRSCGGRSIRGLRGRQSAPRGDRPRGTTLVNLLAGKLTNRYGPRLPLILSQVIQTVGILGLLLVRGDTPTPLLLILLVPLGIGGGLAIGRGRVGLGPQPH
ncbi:hypothetical protein OG229_36630 [Streptomyces platensis]|uniref:hypothetical protein n=1 Tax=Streptomyces platensis TaxID=58346 RepID=UPI002E10DF3D|nr:hypothetical protein OG229_36630 [Streptomyces platensis]